MANAQVRALFESALEHAGKPAIQLVDNDSRNVIAAADVVLVASGTAALETMLVNRPMVVSYRVASINLSAWLKSLKLVKADHVSLPNILAGEALVPELLQQDATGPKLAQAVLAWLEDSDRSSALHLRFSRMNADLRCNAGEKAAAAVSELLSRANLTARQQIIAEWMKPGGGPWQARWWWLQWYSIRQIRSRDWMIQKS